MVYSNEISRTRETQCETSMLLWKNIFFFPCMCLHNGIPESRKQGFITGRSRRVVRPVPHSHMFEFYGNNNNIIVCAGKMYKIHLCSCSFKKVRRQSWWAGNTTNILIPAGNLILGRRRLTVKNNDGQYTNWNTYTYVHTYIGG